MRETKNIVTRAIISGKHKRCLSAKNHLGFIKKTTLVKFVVIATFLIVLCLALYYRNFVLSIINSIFFVNNKSAIVKNDFVNSSKVDEIPAKDVDKRYLLSADVEGDLDSLSMVCKISADGQESVFDGTIILGDLTFFGIKRDLVEFSDELQSCKKPLYVIPGDRDLYASKGLTNYLEVFPKHFFYDETNEFLFIDNADEYNGISDQQFSYITEHINKTKYVFLHNPIYYGDSLIDQLFKKGMGQYDPEVEEQRIKLLEIIRNANVKAVFAGDRHVFSQSVDNVKNSLSHYVIGSLNTERSISGATYAIFTIYKDGTYTVENIGLAN